MSLFEVEQERDKKQKIEDVAARGAAVAAELGQDPDAVTVFLHHYFRHVDAADVDERAVEDLLGLVESHYRAALHRAPGEATIAIRTPSQSDDGWTAGGATVVQIVTDDHPFLVDSVTMEVLRQGWSIREVFHPQFSIRRDAGGSLQEVLSSEEAAGEPTVLQESWMHLEILPPPSQETPEALSALLEQGLREVLLLVEEAVTDWEQMMVRSGETVALLADPAFTGAATDPTRAEEAASASELLTWLNANHFTFLGYREYRMVDDVLVGVPGTGLGISRADQPPAGAFQALPPRGSRPVLMVVTKDSSRSRVHRPAYLDYLGFRSFSPEGEVVGERRFLGLFSSSAYSESVARVPVLRQKALGVLQRSGYDAHSHGGKAIIDVLETYPRDELFQTQLPELSGIVEKVAHLKERRQVRLFVRRDPYGRYLSCLIFLPRDRYTTAVRNRMEEVLMRTLGGGSIDYSARVTESVLARLHFVVRMPTGQKVGEVDVRQLERELTLATRSWEDEFADRVAAEPDLGRLAALVGSLPEGYKEEYSPRQAILDLQALSSLAPDADMSMALYVPERADDEADLRLKIFRRDGTMSLSRILPHLSLLGVDVIDERPYELGAGTQDRAWIYEFGIRIPGGRDAARHGWDNSARHHFMAAFEASYSGLSEPDAFNALVMGANLSWRQVGMLRAVGRYLRQAGSTYSQTYLAQALSSNVDIARTLVTLFETRFDPALDLSLEERRRQADAITAKIIRALGDVASLDHDRIVRSYLAVLTAVIRTNAFQPDRQALTLKLLPRLVPDLPEPRPAFEIFVYSPRLEGVHLRFGAVARGGLRWSDRAEDFRTEILGLVKAQMVKNTVIVPVGAKGGFYGKKLPDPTTDRDAWMAEGIACYQLFVSSLLDVTDNIVDDGVVPPENTVRYDGDDPYLVVAADKGTATFSDIANEISVRRGFWLGDAFASGGSAGYDHKKMGITARGAWESVRRHFKERGLDTQTTDFTCVGIGDMSGDVFGNGMLLSHHIALVAAFDHRHIFLDPTPDPERSWQERSRLFALTRSSWADYDTSLISAGGGVYPRTLKSVPLTPAVRQVLGLPADVEALSPTELISACLRAPVDLLWNGGIGTYVKAASETSSEVGDKANDQLRVNGGELRASCVGEGGNLGLTQLGRIEYAQQGGRINTDFIDNSAGVDTSDHEVNIKILLAGEVRSGRLSLTDRDELLTMTTDEVGLMVLENNADQNLALANSVWQAGSMAGVHEDWMERLEEEQILDRGIEYLPTAEQMAERRTHGQGLSSPELCVLLAYTKIALEREVLATDLPDDPALAPTLVSYFPTALQQRFTDAMQKHQLRREIITTQAVNAFVNTSGMTCFHRLSGETGAPAAEVIRAQVASRRIFDAARLEESIRDLDHVMDAEVQTRLRLEVRTLVERATRWTVLNRRRPIDITTAVDQLAEGVQQVIAVLPDLLGSREHRQYAARLAGYREAGADEATARAVAVLPPAYSALSVVQTARREEVDVIRVARVHFALSDRLGLDRLLGRVVELPRDDRWQTMARAALRDDLHNVHAQLTAVVLSAGHGSEPAADLVEQWVQVTPELTTTVTRLASICDGRPDLARMSVGLRMVRGLLPAAG